MTKDSENTERIPPFDDEAEAAALGALLLECQRIVPIAQRLGVTPATFFSPSHSIVYQAILGVVEEGRMADVLTVGEWLTRNEKMGLAGGPAALDQLVDKCATVEHAGFYLDIIRQKEILRDLVQFCRETERESYQVDRGDTLVSQTADKISALVERETPQEETNGALMQKSIDRWHDAKEGIAPAIGLTLPWENLTELLCGLEPGLTILAGRPSMGKTTLEDCICTQLASEGITVGRVSLDSSRQALLDRAMCRKAGVSLPKLKFGYATEAQLAQCEEARKTLETYPMHINDRDTDINVIAPWARMMVARYNMKLLTIDYLQIVMASTMGRQQWDAVARVTYVSGTLKRLGFELGIPILALSQLSRANTKDGKPRAPQLSDLRDSGAIEQDAEKVAFVYRDEKLCKEMEENEPGSTKHLRPSWVDCLKHKDGETGKIAFWMRPPYFRFDETDPDFPTVQDEPDIQSGIMPQDFDPEEEQTAQELEL